MRKSFSPDFMAKVALAAIKGDMTTADQQFLSELRFKQLTRVLLCGISLGEHLDGRGVSVSIPFL